ncbi:MAG: acetamidase/formamidase family protein [Candidatus Bipolaricaulia bacterium]
MQRATKEVLYFETGPDNSPTLWVKPGEEFEVETQMNRGPWLDGHPNEKELREKLRGGNPSSGCIYIEDAQPGQVLIVHIGEIDVDPVGFTQFAGSTAAMPAWLGGSGIGAHHRVVEIRNNLIHWSDQVRLPVEPMLGFVGVAPERTRWHNGWAGDWGGNFDIQEITTGASVHLKVNVPGALLHIGDMHTRQGDGEICGAGGIETGGRVRVRCGLAERPTSMITPRIETETHIMTVGMTRPAEDAFRIALEAMILWLEEEYGFARGEAYLYLGQVLEARCTQFVNPHFTYVAKVAKKYLP